MNTLADPEPLTRSAEDYLKAIYRLSGAGQPASTSGIAELLALAPASVSGMVKRLSQQGLLERSPYHGVVLTGEGRRAALRVLRRHRLIESYLVARLGFTWDTVHGEAERLEHAASDDLVERMARALGNPTRDPHGDPIPAADGSLPLHAGVPLADAPPGTPLVVGQVRVDAAEQLRYLGELGLRPGAPVVVEAREPFGGPLTIRTEAGERVLDRELAARIVCSEGVR